MNDLFDSVDLIDEGDLAKALKTAAAVGVVGGAFMAGSKALDKPKDIKPTQSQKQVQPARVEKRPVKVDMSKIASIESSNNPKAVNKRSGARGLTQLMKPTWEEIVSKMSETWHWDEAFDGAKNLAVGSYYMNIEIPRLLKHFGIPDTIETRLTSYNWGVGHLNKAYKKHGDDWQKSLPDETSNYLIKYKGLGEFISERANKYIPLSHDSTGRMKVKSVGNGKIYTYLGVFPRIYSKIKMFADKGLWGKGWQIMQNLEQEEPVVVESSIDFSRGELDPAVWQKTNDSYILKPEVADQIKDVLSKYPAVDLVDAAKVIRIVGSIGTNQFSSDADIDVHIEPDIKKLKEILNGKVDSD